MMFNFLNNLLYILMIFKQVLLDDFHLMLRSSLLFDPMASIDFREFHLALFKYKKLNIFISVDIEKKCFFYFFSKEPTLQLAAFIVTILLLLLLLIKHAAITPNADYYQRFNLIQKFNIWEIYKLLNNHLETS